jgi:hypothetical protein
MAEANPPSRVARTVLDSIPNMPVTGSVCALAIAQTRVKAAATAYPDEDVTGVIICLMG